MYLRGKRPGERNSRWPPISDKKIVTAGGQGSLLSMAAIATGSTQTQALSDEEIVARVLAGETPLYEIVMRRHNQRLYRAVRAIVRDESEAEDIVQETYVRAYRSLHQFEAR